MGEAVVLMWGLRRQTQNLPVGLDPYAIINSASHGFCTAIRGLVYEVELSPLDDLQWKQLPSTEAPYNPTFKNWLCEAPRVLQRPVGLSQTVAV